MMDFVCMADHHFAGWLELCLAALRRADPQARVFVFDLSPEESPAIADLAQRSPGAVHVAYPESQWRWPQWIDGAGFDFFWPHFPAAETLKYWGRRLRVALTGHGKEDWMTDKRRHAEKMRRFCRIVSQKPGVLAKALDLSGRDLVFVDADAIVLKSLAPVFERDFDLAVTSLEPAEVFIGPDPAECPERPSYPIRAVNTGMVFLRNNAATRSLLADWIREMEAVRHVAVEQTAIANMILRHVPDFFTSFYAGRTLATAGGTRARVMSLPVALYNHTKVRVGAKEMPDGIFVAHFVGSLKKARHWPMVSALIRRSLAAPAPGGG